MQTLREDVVEIDGIYVPKISPHTTKTIEATNGLLLAISPYLKGKTTMIQAGGNCGLTVKQFVDTFQTIYTFEPDAVNFYCLNLNVPNRNVIKFQSCLGKERALVKLSNDYPEECGAIHVSNERTGAETIPVFMIDDLALNSCDLIALDVEGYEYNVLLGAITTLRKHKPVLCLEQAPPWLARYSTSMSIIENFIAQMGYRPVSSYRTSYSTDIIYVAH